MEVIDFFSSGVGEVWGHFELLFLGDLTTGIWDEKITESCKVAKQYENNVYSPTLDGTYNISLIKEPIFATYMKKLQIKITGTQIPLQARTRHQEWEAILKSLESLGEIN